MLSSIQLQCCQQNEIDHPAQEREAWAPVLMRGKQVTQGEPCVGSLRELRGIPNHSVSSGETLRPLPWLAGPVPDTSVLELGEILCSSDFPFCKVSQMTPLTALDIPLWRRCLLRCPWYPGGRVRTSQIHRHKKHSPNLGIRGCLSHSGVINERSGSSVCYYSRADWLVLLL